MHSSCKKKYEDKLKELRNYEAKLRDESINIAIPVGVGDIHSADIIKYYQSSYFIMQKS